MQGPPLTPVGADFTRIREPLLARENHVRLASRRGSWGVAGMCSGGDVSSHSPDHPGAELTASSCFSCPQRPLSISPLACLGHLGFPDGSGGKESTWVQSLGQEDSLEKEIATHSSIVAWKFPRTEEPGRSQSRTQLSAHVQLAFNLLQLHSAFYFHRYPESLTLWGLPSGSAINNPSVMQEKQEMGG